jgi:hypothetical protein
MKPHPLAVDVKTIIRRKRMNHMSALHCHARQIGMNPTGSDLRKQWREACRKYPGDDGIKDDAAEAMLMDTLS